MAKTLSQLIKEIESLSKAADVMRKRDVPAIVARIKRDIAAYSLTPEDLGFGSTDPQPAPASRKMTKPAKKQGKLPAKYRDDQGNSWTGRGSKPGWLRDAVAAGQSLESYAVNTAPASGDDAKPVRSAKPTAKSAKSASKVKYRDDEGHTWSGYGPKPGWLKAAIEGGKTLEEMAADK